MKKIKNYNYDFMGCFKTPKLNFTILNDWEDNNEGYHRADYDMNIIIGTEKKLIELYNSLINFLSTVDITLGYEPDVMMCGIFLNNENSMLFASDGTWEFEGHLLNQIGVPYSDYICESHCYDEKIKDNYPQIYSKIKDFFHTI